MAYHDLDDLLWPWMLNQPRGTSQARGDVLYRVLYAPDDGELLRPLWNVGATFTTCDVAGMVMDGGLPEGTRLRDADGTEWLVRDCALQEAHGARRLAPVETNKTDKIATLREVTGG